MDSLTQANMRAARLAELEQERAPVLLDFILAARRALEPGGALYGNTDAYAILQGLEGSLKRALAGPPSDGDITTILRAVSELREVLGISAARRTAAIN